MEFHVFNDYNNKKTDFIDVPLNNYQHRLPKKSKEIFLL